MIMHESLIPPEKKGSKEEWEKAPWKTEYDVMSCLRELGHEVVALGVDADLGGLRSQLHNFKPNIVFNLLEEFKGEAFFDYHIVAYLELMGAKYTGCNPRGLLLSRDKALGKKILKYHRVPTPDFHVFKKDKIVRVNKQMKFPLFVKTLNEEASLGISQDSVVVDAKSLKNRVEYLIESFGTDVIAESYIDGREFYVSIMGNDRLQAFPIVELEFGKISERSHPIATRKVKWDLAYRKKYGIEVKAPTNLSVELEKKIMSVCKRAYKSLDLSGYARMDLRVTPEGAVYLIEANPNPDVGYGDEFHKSGELQGLSYDKIIQRILKLGQAWSPSQ